jgi:hypothetical protein
MNDRETLEAIRDDYYGILADAGTAAQIGLEAMDLADQLAEALRAWDIGGVNCWCGAVDAVPKRDHSPACEFSRKALAAYEEARR